jgi:hypothetical protein
MDLLQNLALLNGLTLAYKTKLIEATSVCLESQGHDTQVEMSLVVSSEASVLSFERFEVTPVMRTTYNDEQEATEWGAVGIALVIATDTLGYRGILRSRKGTGFDYWLGETTVTPQARLEVSGIRQGDSTRIQARVREKQMQTAQSDAMLGHLPAIIIVVEFGQPCAIVEIGNERQ